MNPEIYVKGQIEYFDYEKCKAAFKKIQYNYIKRNSEGIVAGKVSFWTREKVEIYIDIILDYKKKKESYSHDEDVSRYDAIKKNGVYILVLKGKTFRGNHIEVVPFEDCFDKIVYVHRNFGHNKRLIKTMYKTLTRKYVIDKIWVFQIHRACNVCNSSAPLEVSELKTDKVTNQNKFNKIYQATVINMKETDNEPKYSALLVLSDKYTNFVFMRPLPKIHEDFIAIELVKLFADYGHPCIIETTLKAIFSPVIKLLPNFGNAFTINIIQSPFTDNSWHQRALVYLQEWMSINETENWVSGCPIVQWQLNNLRRRDNTTPYKQVFGVDPVRDLITSYTKL